MPAYSQNGPTGAPRGSLRNPNAPWDFLPNTQNVMLGGFAPTPRVVPHGDPDPKFLAPHYPPKSNEFYELTSDGRLSEVYFENARIRRFRVNPDLSILSAALSPAPSTRSSEGTPPSPIEVLPNRIYIGQGNWRQANEKATPLQENKRPYRHKHAQTPTLHGSRPWQQVRRREAHTDEEFWKASERLDDEDEGDDDAKGWVQKLEEDDTRRDKVSIQVNKRDDDYGKFQIQGTIHRSAEGSKRDEQALDQNMAQLVLRHSPKRNNVRLFEKVLEQHTARPNQDNTKGGDQEPRRSQALYSTREVSSKDPIVGSSLQEIGQDSVTEEFPLYGALNTTMPGNRSGDNTRIGRTRSNLESAVLPEPAREVRLEEDDVSLDDIDSSDSDSS